MTESAPVLAYDDIVWACTNLCDLLAYENEALAVRDMATIQQLADNKLALVRIYEEAVVPLSDDPKLVETLEDEQRAELKALGLRLHGLVTENANRLNAAMEATRMVMENIAAAARNHAAPAVSYNKKGSFGDTATAEQPALSVDKKF
jgi:hypothetical protein